MASFITTSDSSYFRLSKYNPPSLTHAATFQLAFSVTNLKFSIAIESSPSLSAIAPRYILICQSIVSLSSFVKKDFAIGKTVESVIARLK